MKNNKAFKYGYLIIFIGILFPTIKIQAQQIIIDNPVKAGELTLFPVMGDENTYYYLSDKLRLATDKNGKPQFSFLKYVENVRSAPGAEDIREGTGGGILHFVISLSVTPEQLAEAKNELLRINPKGIVKGPVIYSRGTMTIISSFTNTKGDLTKQVVGIGNAPLIDGEKAAVSMELTKKGAKILWEEFKMPTPDVSFSFEMELSGFRAPKKAIIEADWEKVYSSHNFQAGAMGKYGNIMFGGEIELAFDKLVNNGAITITNMGADKDMEELVKIAYNKISELMFEPVGTGNPAVQELLKSAVGKKSALDRATELYEKEKTKTSTGTKTKPKPKPKPKPQDSNKKKTSYFDLKNSDDYLLASTNKDFYVPGYSYQKISTSDLVWEPKPIKEIIKDYINLLPLPLDEKTTAIVSIGIGDYVSISKLLEIAENNPEYTSKSKEYYKQYLLSNYEKEFYSDILNGKKDPNKGYYDLIKRRVRSIIDYQDFLNDKQKEYILNVDLPEDFTSAWNPRLGLTYVAWVNRDELKHLPKIEKSAEIVQKVYDLRDNLSEEQITAIEKQISGIIADTVANKKDSINVKPGKSNETLKPEPKPDNQNKKLSDSKKNKTGAGATVGAGTATSNAASKKNKNTSATKNPEKQKTDFKMAVMATYRLKSVKQTGKFKLILNKYTADKLNLRFDENIGHVDCTECFKEVNLDDPMYKQREIVAMLDGFNYNDFGKYINYVNLKMKKTHQDGSITVDEVRIDRDNFMKSANNFKLLYGWKGDNDWSKWFDYEIQTQWSFFGGGEVSEDWKKVNTNIIDLAAPYRRTSIELESDPELLKENKVRMVTVKLYYKIGDSEQVKQVTLMPSKGQFSEKIDIMLPANNPEYAYEISWRFYGNKIESSGRQTTSEPILFIDEL